MKKPTTRTREVRCPSCKATTAATHETSNNERKCPRCGYEWRV